MKPGTGNGQPSSSTLSTGDHLIRLPATVVAVEVPHRARKGGPDEALLGIGLVEPARLEGDKTRLAEIERLLEPALGEVPEVESAPVAAGLATSSRSNPFS